MAPDINEETRALIELTADRAVAKALEKFETVHIATCPIGNRIRRFMAVALGFGIGLGVGLGLAVPGIAGLIIRAARAAGS